jgi:hypothetical protein
MMPESTHLLDSLWQMSAQWLQLRTFAACSVREQCMAHTHAVDLAGCYARDVWSLQQTLSSNNDYDLDFFDHSGTRRARSAAGEAEIAANPRTLRRPSSIVSPMKSSTQEATLLGPKQRTPSMQSSRPVRNAIGKSWSGASRRQTQRLRQLPTSPSRIGESSSRWASEATSFSVINGSNRNVADSNSEFADPNPVPSNSNINGPDETRHSSTQQQMTNPYAASEFVTDESNWPQDALYDLSDALMQPQFLQQDRVITFEDMYFRMDGMEWS